MYKSNDLHSLIQDIYLAGAKASRWPTFLESFCRVIDAPSAVISFIDRTGASSQVSASVGLADEAIALYHARFRAIDPFAQGTAALGPLRPGFVGLAQDLISEEELHQPEFYNAFGERYGVIGGLIAAIYADEGPFVAVLGANRWPGRFFGTREVELVRTLLPHLRTSLQLHHELVQRTEAGQAALATLNGLRVAAFICDEDGEVIFQNPKAESLGFVRGVLGRIQVGDVRESNALQAAIAAAAGHSNGVEPRRDLCVPLSGTPFKIAVVSAVHLSDLLPTTRRLVAVLLPSEEELSPDMFKAFATGYGLTPTEGRILVALVDGRSVREVASAVGVSYETARTHVKRVLEKTGCRRQAEVVRKALTSVPPV